MDTTMLGRLCRRLLSCVGPNLGMGAAMAVAAVQPATFDLGAIRDAQTLETRLVQDWQPAPRDPAVRQKVIEITLCEWWPGQKVRVPVVLSAPADGRVCRNVIVSNMGLSPRAALPSGVMLRLLKEDGVGVVLVGMGPIEAMPPVGKLHLGMKRQLLATKNARFTPAWIWGMTDMRGLTAALAETGVFQPGKVLATGGSKRGIGAVTAAIHDDRFTAIVPVVTPLVASPGGPFVLGTESEEIVRSNAAFLAALHAGGRPGLPATTLTALAERDERRSNERITLAEARAAGWGPEDVASLGEQAWAACRITDHLPSLRRRGLAMFYNNGTNDNVSPGLVDFGRRLPTFPMYLVPGGQHGGPTTTGFTRQVPLLPEIEDNLFAFARQHFSSAREVISIPRVTSQWDPSTRRLRVTVVFPDGIESDENTLWWSQNRHPPGSLAYEYDAWNSASLVKDDATSLRGEIAVASDATTVDLLTTHRRTMQGLPIHVSSPALQVSLRDR